MTTLYIYYGTRHAVMAKFPEIDPRTPGAFLIVTHMGRRGALDDPGGSYLPADVQASLRHFRAAFKNTKEFALEKPRVARVKMKPQRVRLK